MDKLFPKNYKPTWEGQTKSGIKKRIFGTYGTLYIRLIDSQGYELNDSINNELLAKY